MNEKTFVLTDGSRWTLKEMMAHTGLEKGMLYTRTQRGISEKEELFAPRQKVSDRPPKVYTLTDGSEWTANSLAKHLNCKKATAQSRFYSKFPLDPERVLKPVVGSNYETDCVNNKVISERVKGRMYYDAEGHWKLFNRCT